MIDSSFFFDGWHGPVRIAVLGLAGYAALIIMLRLSSKRTLAEMNVFDFVYIVVVGDLLAIMMLDENVSLAEGLAGIGVLLGIKVFLGWLTTRSKVAEHVINGEPTLLVRRGRFLHEAMRAQRVTEREILASVREQGVADLGDVEAVVLETNGTFSVVHVGAPREASTLKDVPEVADTDREQPRETWREGTPTSRRPSQPEGAPR